MLPGVVTGGIVIEGVTTWRHVGPVNPVGEIQYTLGYSYCCHAFINKNNY